MLHLNVLLEQQAQEHDQLQGSLKAALKVADDDIEKLKGQYRKLQSDLSTEKALRERDQEDAQKELQELARLQLELKDRDDRLESMRTEAIMLKAEVLTTASPRSQTPLNLRMSVSNQMEPPPDLDSDLPASARSSKRLSMTAGSMAQTEWQSLMASSHKLSLDEVLVLARQRKNHLQQTLNTNAKRDMAELKTLSIPAPAVCVSWQALLVLLGIAPTNPEANDGAVCMEWRALRKLINTNPGQFDKASVFHLMERHELGGAARPADAADMRHRCRQAELLMNGVSYEACMAESGTIAALFEWITLVLDVQHLVDKQ